MEQQPHNNSGAGNPTGRKLTGSLFATALVLAVITFVILRQGVVPDSGAPSPARPFIHEFMIFGTYGRLTFWAPRDRAAAVAESIVSDLNRLQQVANLFSDDSELTRMNKQAVRAPFKCSHIMWQLLQASRRAYDETGGAFDVSVGPLMKLWGFHQERQTLPTPAEVEEALEAVGLEKVVFDDENQAVFYTHPEMYLDFGGIIKGYALDKAVQRAHLLGIRSGMIDLGGNVYCLEEPPPGKLAYSIGIRNPFDRNSLLETVQVTNCAIATSGNYEHYVEIEGEVVHHIIDPRTGYPVAGVASVTVITPLGIDSDIFSTAIFVAGDDLIEPFRKIRKRSSVMKVGLSLQGKSVVETYGWIWE